MDTHDHPQHPPASGRRRRLAAALLACAGSTAIRRNATAVVDPATRDQAFSRALGVVQERGYVVVQVYENGEPKIDEERQIFLEQRLTGAVKIVRSG